MVEVSFLRILSDLQWNGLLFIRHPHLGTQREMLMLSEQLVLSKKYTLKCGDDFLLGLLMNRTTPLLIVAIQNWLLSDNLQTADPEPGM